MSSTMAPNPGPWLRTPWWVFWQPRWYRHCWKLDRQNEMWLRGIEYQHENFVARELMERTYDKVD